MTINEINKEKELLRAVAGGDTQAFTRLFEHYQPLIYTYILRLAGDEALAQEIVQDTFLKAWLKRETLGEINNFGGWLSRIAANFTYDALRKTAAQKRKLDEMRMKLPETENEATFTPTEVMLLEKQYADIIQQAIDTLPARQLQAFQLIKLEGLTREQAASAMGISAESVKTNLAIALQKIRAYCLKRMGALGLLLFFWANR